MRDKQIKR